MNPETIQSQPPISPQTPVIDPISPEPKKHRKHMFLLIFVALLLFVILGLFFGIRHFGNQDPAEAESKTLKSFGVIGDGTTDDTVALQKAIDYTSKKRGILTLPPGRYRITKPLFMKSNLRLRGTPGKSVIVQTDSPYDMVLGNAFPSNYDKRQPDFHGKRGHFENLATKQTTWAKGSNTITLKYRSDVKKLKAGEIVCIRSTKQFDNNDGWSQPDFVQFTRIEKIFDSSRRLVLADKALNSIGDPQDGPPQICKIDGYNPHLSYIMDRDVPWYAVQSSELSGIVFEGGEIGLAAGLCYSCTVKDIQFRGVDTPIALNALVKNNFTNISGDYTTEAVEAAMSSTQTTFKNLNFTYRPISCSLKSEPDPLKCSPPVPSSKRPSNCSLVQYPNPMDCPLVASPAISVGERSVGITFDNFTLTVGRNATLHGRLIGIGDAQNIRIINSHIDTSGGGGQQVFEIRGNYNAAAGSKFAVKNYTIANNVIKLGIAKEQLAIIVGSKNQPIQNLNFSNNKWSGTRTSTGQAYWAGNYVKSWSVINESIPVANRFRVTHDATHFNSDPITKNVKFGDFSSTL